MNDYIHNKQPKDINLLKILRRTISLDKKRNAFTTEDFANEIGLAPGTLDNKLKPSSDIDMTISEFIHILSITGDTSALDYIASLFDKVLVCKLVAKANISDLNLLVDKANMENSDVFRAVKDSISDGVITAEEQKIMLKEIDEAQQANAQLKDMVVHLALANNECC